MTGNARGAAWTWRDFALAAFCLVLAWRLLSFVLGGAIGSIQPDIALALDSSRSQLSVRLAHRALSGDDREELALAVARLHASLMKTPMAPQVVTTLGLLAERMDSPEVAERLVKIGGVFSVRDAVAHAWLLDEDLKRGDVAEAVRRLDLLLRTAPRGTDTILQAALPIFGASIALEPFLNVLAERPAWRPRALTLLARTAEARTLWDINEGLQRSAAPASQSELRPFLERFVKEGLYDEAYIMWLQTVPTERLARSELLYNARFQHSVANLPFDWTIRQSPGALVRISGDRGRRTLDVDFFGARMPFRDVSHMMLLSPGDYRFVGMERALSLRNERGLRWRLTCMGDPKSAPNNTTLQNLALMETPLLVGDVDWRRFAVDFTVPEDCVAQNLVLELAARVALEQEVSGGASYMGLGIEARAPASRDGDLPNMN
jgi:hypothetical protein